MLQMRKILIIIILIICPQIAFAEDEYATQEILNNPQEGEISLFSEEATEIINDATDDIEEELNIIHYLGKEPPKNTTEAPLIEKILKTNITRTDVPGFLLKEELTHKYQKGILSETELYGGYRGSISGLFTPHNYSTTYDNNATEFGVYGKFKDPDYSFKLMFRPIPIHGKSYMDGLFGDIYLVNSKIPHHDIIAGFQRIQTGIEGGSGQYTLPFYARSQIARSFGNSRALAAKIVGNYNYADYSLSFGSSGRYLVRGMPGSEFAGWLNIKPFGSSDGKLGKLTIGGGLTAGKHDINYTIGSAYIGYKHKKLWTNFEAAIADGYNGSNGASSNKASGFAYTIGWKIVPQLQIIGRIDQFNPNRDKHHDTKREYTAGINWFIKGQALRFILNYVYCQNQNTHDSHKLIFATQIMI